MLSLGLIIAFASSLDLTSLAFSFTSRSLLLSSSLYRVDINFHIHLTSDRRLKSRHDKTAKASFIPQSPGQLDPNQLIHPPWIVKLMENGWTEYFSLEDLTNVKCRASAHTRRTTDKNLIVGKNGTITFENVLADVSKEHLLDISSWREAIFRMCEIIERYLPGRYSRAVADQWRLHAERLLAKSDFAQNFSAYLAYDIRLRQAYVHDYALFRPDEFQWAMWDTVKDEQRDKKFRSIEHAITSLQLPYNPSNPRPQSMSANFQYPSSFPTNSGFRSSSTNTNPGRTASRSSNTGRNGHTSAPTARAKCWICRSLEHIPRNCPDSTNGFITKTADGKWLTVANEQICFGFNGIYGCSKPDCKFFHGCSLCGSREHSVQSHPS